MATVIVLFNLREGATREDYERWARETDVPTVIGLPSVSGFEVFRTSGLLGADTLPPYAYVEVIQIEDMDGFGRDIAAEQMQQVAAEFQQFAADPVFMLAERSA